MHNAHSLEVVAASAINVGAKNVSKTGEGAFTGEISVNLVADAGVQWVLAGHSECWSLYGETDEDTEAKVELGMKKGLSVMLAIGEQLSERQGGTTVDVCARQIKAVIAKVTDWSKFSIAYEPVWAIGTSIVATPLQAQETHGQVRRIVCDLVGEQIANDFRILYGGSVNPKNCKELSEMPDVDGFLVGGASCKPDFTTITTTAQELYSK